MVKTFPFRILLTVLAGWGFFILSLAWALNAKADDISLSGYVDLRLVLPSEETSWFEGGLGKLRYGDSEESGARLEVAEILTEATAQISPELSALASFRFTDNQRSPVDVVEAYLRYRPVSTGRLRWSIKAGAFFPPISLENDEIGWTSEWTLTPSAINTWVGEELRTIGAEGKLELRGTTNSFEVVGSVYGWNDPAGVLIADRGWALHDRPTSLFDRPRLPDAFAAQLFTQPPLYTPMFKEIDDNPGYYVGASWKHNRFGKLSLLWYDNLADPAALRDQYAWRTEFWSLAYDTSIGDLTIKMQAMTGETEIAPFAEIWTDYVFESAITDFSSAFVLIGWAFDDWRLAARAEVFETEETIRWFEYGEYEYEGGINDETGHAFTFAATWVPEEWLRVTAEGIFTRSNRAQREVLGADRSATETQVQLSTKIYF